jgi:hypothetical protein
MDIMLLRLFQSQVEFQCRVAISAAVDLNAGLAKLDHTKVFGAIQNLLNAAANISKACWGTKGKLSVEREPLRDSIGVTDASPLQEVNMRNNFEHFDERLDRWWRIHTSQHSGFRPRQSIRRWPRKYRDVPRVRFRVSRYGLLGGDV